MIEEVEDGRARSAGKTEVDSSSPYHGDAGAERLMSTQQSQRRRRCRQTRARDRCSSSSVAKRKKEVGKDDDVSPGAKRLRSSRLQLPEDIWCHIHSLMPLRDADRTACVSCAFSESWRCHPNLNFTNKSILGTDSNGCGMDFIRTIGHVLKKHSGINVKTLTLELPDYENAWRRQLDSWLKIAMKPGIEEMTLIFGFAKATYKFPCRLLSDGITNSVRCLDLQRCVFCPTVKLGPFRSLAMLRLSKVCITGDTLGCLLSNSLALESLELNSCDKLDCLKIPCQLQRLSYLSVFLCRMLYVIEIKAPNLGVFNLDAENVTKVSLGVSLKLKLLFIESPDLTSYTDLRLLSSVPDLEGLYLKSWCQVASSPLMLPVKFLHLKEFNLSLTGQGVSEAYDYFSLASLLDCCPSLENIFLNVSHKCVGHETMSEGPTRSMQMPGQRQHGNLKSVTILGFCYAKSLVELTCYMVENAVSLQSLTLDIHGSCFLSVSGVVLRPMYDGKFVEAPQTLLAIRTYIQGKIPSRAKLNVLEPCGPCNTVVGQ